MGNVRRLRAPTQRPGFVKTLADLGIVPGSAAALDLTALIKELRMADTLPFPEDLSVSLPGAHCFARRIGKTQLWLCYAPGVDSVELVAVQSWEG